jgi:hypothetical protein
MYENLALFVSDFILIAFHTDFHSAFNNFKGRRIVFVVYTEELLYLHFKETVA